MTSILPLIARRILVSVVILFIVSALLFCILRLLPVDPAAMSLPPNATLAEIEAKRHEMGLDQPLFRQYLIWAAQVLHRRMQNSSADTMNRMTTETRIRRAMRGRMEVMQRASALAGALHLSPLAGRGRRAKRGG